MVSTSAPATRVIFVNGRLYRGGVPNDMPKLTKRLIDATPCPAKGQTFLRDDELSGFALRLTPGGKTFIIEKRLHKRLHRVTIGAYGAYTVEQARHKAHAMLQAVFEGHDPAQERRERRQELTWSELTDLYLTRHAPRKRTAWNDKNMLTCYFESWQHRRLSTLTLKDMAVLHGQLGEKTPYAANRVVALVRKMFNLARLWGIYRGDNPATGIELFPEEKRDRFVQPHELPKLFEALNAEPNPYVKTALLVALLTGARRGEVLAMRWADVDLHQAIWRIPDTKARPAPLASSAATCGDAAAGLTAGSGQPLCVTDCNGKGSGLQSTEIWDDIRCISPAPQDRILCI
jgi:integrase